MCPQQLNPFTAVLPRDFVEFMNLLDDAAIDYLIIDKTRVQAIGKTAQIANKLATGRAPDLADLVALRRRRTRQT
jgi:hypothetical protein